MRRTRARVRRATKSTRPAIASGKTRAGETLEVDAVLYATGRVPNTDGLGLDRVGIETGRAGEIVVDGYSRSSVPSVWAIGDVTQRVSLTPVALHEGTCFARTVFGGVPSKPDHENVPSAVFSQPAIGCVGLGEAQARERFGAVDVYRESFRPLRQALGGRGEETLVKLLVDAGSDRVLGCHMVGPEAAEVVQGFAVALRCGVTKAQLDATIGIHPTSAEEFVTLREKVRSSPFAAATPAVAARRAS